MKTKRIRAGACAAAVLAGILQTFSLPTAAASDVIKVEFESGVLTDCENREPITWEQIDEDGFGNVCDMTGWSGDSYVYIDRKDAAVTVKVDMPEEGYYELQLCYIQCIGSPEKPDKTQYLIVNGESQGEVLFPFNSGEGWQMLPAGYVHLNKGENEICIKSYWGYTFLDYLTLAEAPAYLTNFSPAEAPCNPNASDEARKLYAYLRSMYGNHILAGQQEYCGSHNYNKNAQESQGLPIDYLVDNEAEFEYIQEVTGKQPAIRGIDFLFYNTTQPYFDDAPERVIAWYKDKGGIPTVTYHWNVPTDGKDSTDAAFYVPSTGNSPATTFSAKNAVQKGTWENDKINEDIALLAEQLGKARDAKVPILFRPLHEAEGAWFWWGADGPEACVALYRYLWDKLTNEYKLDNLLWIWTASTSAHAADWYPGDEYVDFQGCDKYNAINNNDPNPSAIAATFYSMVAQTKGQKMVCMSENDTIPSLENLLKDKAAWLYFCPWYQRYLTGLNDPAELKKIYNSEYCITLDELPDWDTYDPELPPPTTAVITTSPADTDGLLGDVDDNGEVELNDVVLLCRAAAGQNNDELSVQGRLNGDVDHDGKITNDDVIKMLRYIAGLLTYTEFTAP